jgi:tellurite resistance protein TerC
MSPTTQPIATQAPAALWFLFWGLFLFVSTIDYYAVTHRRTAVGVTTALRWTAIWIAVALGFAAAIYYLHPRGSTLYVEYVTGYLTEYSLSVDNLFVFILIFSLMGVSEVAQPKLIKLGIYLSIALRIVFILFGIALVARFHWLLYLFGIMLLWTAWKMLMAGEEDRIDPTKNLLHRIATRLCPVHDEPQESSRLFSRSEGHLCITPLFLVFLVIGSTDVLFAIDSIPAIMGISQDPFVVLTSNVFAVLGLNSLFFALRGLMGIFRYLKHGVSLILFFIGTRMIAAMYAPLEQWFKGRSQVSLLVIGSILLTSIGVSVWHARLHPARSAAD